MTERFTAILIFRCSDGGPQQVLLNLEDPHGEWSSSFPTLLRTTEAQVEKVLDGARVIQTLHIYPAAAKELGHFAQTAPDPDDRITVYVADSPGHVPRLLRGFKPVATRSLLAMVNSRHIAEPHARGSLTHWSNHALLEAKRMFEKVYMGSSFEDWFVDGESYNLTRAQRAVTTVQRVSILALILAVLQPLIDWFVCGRAVVTKKRVVRAAEHVPEPVSEPVPEPVAEPIPELVAEPVAEPIPEPVAEPIPEPVAEPIPEPIQEPIPEPIPEPVPEPAPEPPAECAICFNDQVDCILVCGHVFHARCINKWKSFTNHYNRAATCPLCRGMAWVVWEKVED